MWGFFQFINDDCTLTILDIDAAMTEVPDYQNLINIKRARLIGFEPDADQCRRLDESYGSPHRFLPYFVGDGGPAVFHGTNWSPIGSLFEPSTPLLEKLHNLDELTTPVARYPITAVRLDDIAEIDDVDFIKIDAQGSELNIFQNASEILASAVLRLQSGGRARIDGSDEFNSRSEVAGSEPPWQISRHLKIPPPQISVRRMAK